MMNKHLTIGSIAGGGQNCPIPWGNPGPHLIHGYSGPPKAPPQMAAQIKIAPSPGGIRVLT